MRSLILGVAVVVLSVTSSLQAALYIDDFNDTNTVLVNSANFSTTITPISGTGKVMNTSGSTVARDLGVVTPGFIVPTDNFTIKTGNATSPAGLLFTNPSESTTLTITDRFTSGGALNVTTDGTNSFTGILLDGILSTTLPTTSFTLTLSDGTNSSSVNFALLGNTSPQEVFVPFTLFTGVTLTAVTSVALTVYDAEPTAFRINQIDATTYQTGDILIGAEPASILAWGTFSLLGFSFARFKRRKATVAA